MSTVVNAFVQKTVEDGVKTGLAAAGITGASTVADLTAHPLVLVAAFAGGFVTSVVFSLISQPFGNPASNHIFGELPEAQVALERAVAQVAANAVQQHDEEPQPAEKGQPESVAEVQSGTVEEPAAPAATRYQAGSFPQSEGAPLV